ncbi:Spo0E family sporulation regulatory protein-aspartic acid phosphatase [Bacillus songklensis]|uniref:Spo0E family sporulation regulatory protein-aspartic acid phosphatase n=1 Tax=Bacillus songklensis TaxID=1069116 RepID=A0ABV8AW44_9BACI
MILNRALELTNNIQQLRAKMYDIAEYKGISDPEVLQVSCLLDEEILSLQKIFNKGCPEAEIILER